ncbi:hypothetical protein [Paenibacillus sp.]|uniref:hypothetical protein n=1 Tax=Paenibacillus sp. TaxID=58172 RepID=UPI002D790437|nr:hypothetical protein [Paenibacillus sp.]
MSFNSILVMCFLIFALSGQDRLSWAPGPADESADAMVSATAEETVDDGGTGEFGPVDIAAVPEPPPAAGANVAEVPLEGVAIERPLPRTPGDEVACAAGFALALPPSDSSRYTIFDWMTEEGRAATIRYEFANGAVLEFTQAKLGVERSGESGREGATSLADLALPLPRLAAAETRAALDIAWQDAERAYAIRAYGVTEQEAKAWIRSLEPPSAGCLPPSS